MKPEMCFFVAVDAEDAVVYRVSLVELDLSFSIAYFLIFLAVIVFKFYIIVVKSGMGHEASCSQSYVSV